MLFHPLPGCTDAREVHDINAYANFGKTCTVHCRSWHAAEAVAVPYAQSQLEILMFHVVHGFEQTDRVRKIPSSSCSRPSRGGNLNVSSCDCANGTTTARMLARISGSMLFTCRSTRCRSRAAVQKQGGSTKNYIYLVYHRQHKFRHIHTHLH